MFKQFIYVFTVIFALNGYVVKAEDKNPNIVDIYVSLESRLGNGSFEKPFNDISFAKNYAKELLKKRDDLEGINIVFRGGRYEVSDTISFTKEDSGTEKCPITYKAYQDEKVFFDGGISVYGSAFEPVDKNSLIYQKIPETSREYVKVLDISGYTEFPKITFVQDDIHVPYRYTRFMGGPDNVSVTYDNDWMVCSRWPNYDWSRTGKIIRNGQGENAIEFEIDPQKAEQWKDADQAWLKGYWSAEWDGHNISVSRVKLDTSTIETGMRPRSVPVSKGKKFYIFNVLEELDVENEFFIDANNSKLYIFPYKDDLKTGKFNERLIQIPMMKKPMFYMDGTEYVTFEGLTFENSRNAFLEMKDTRYCNIRGCVLRNNSCYGITLIGKQSYKNTIDSCDMYGMGSNAIYAEPGDMANCISSETEIINNKIHNIAVLARTNKPPIHIDNGVGVRVAHNEIFNTPHNSIYYRGQEHIVEYNEIYDTVNDDIGDAGSIHVGANAHSWRNRIFYNYFHDTYKDSLAVVYFDDGICDTNVYGNLYYNTGQGFFSHGGTMNNYENNILIYPTEDNDYSASWSGPRTYSWDSETLYSEKASNYIDPKYIYDLWASDKFKEKYPEFVKLIKHGAIDFNEGWGKNNVTLYQNAIPNFDSVLTLDPINSPIETTNNYQTLEDIGFVDLENQNFNLKDDARIYDILPDFKPIPFEKMGRYENKWSKKNYLVTPELVTPGNKEEDLNANEIIFNWKKQENTRVYEFELATDPEFKEIVRKEDVKGECIVIKNLRHGKIRYFWRVTAKDSNSKMMERGSTAVSAVYSFTTAKSENIDFTEIESLLSKANKIYETMEEGEGQGQFFIGAKQDMESLISDLSGELTNPKQSNMNLKINTSNYQTRYNRIIGRRNHEILLIDNILYPGQGVWTTQPNRGDYHSGMFTWTRNTRQDDTMMCYVADYIQNYQILKFKARADYTDMTGLTGKWFGYMLRFRDASVSFNNQECYIVIVKPDQGKIELQRYGTSAKNLYKEYYTDQIKYGEDYEVEYGAIDTEDGSVRIIFRVNGETIIDYMDSEDPVRDAGYFGVFQTKGNLNNPLVLMGVNQ